MGQFIRHMSCEACGSSDANSLYADGSSYCFSCQRAHAGSETPLKATQSPKSNFSAVLGAYQDIKSRKITEAICRKYGYQVSIEGEKCHIANYKSSDGTRVAQKIRKANKQFSIIGDGKDMPLFGQNLFNGGKSVVITEGEIDALSVAQAFDGKWPAVSLPNGAQSAVKAIRNAYEWLNGFEKVVICFDQDEPGRKATQEVCEALPVGKAYIMTLARKDASEVLINDGAAPITSAYWNAAPWRPDGIIAGADLTKERLKKAAVRGYALPYPELDNMLGGLREGELVLLTAGSGIGKSTLAREIAYDLHQKHQLTIGNIFLEESAEKTGQGYVAIHTNTKLGALRANPDIITDAQWDDAIDNVIKDRMYFYDHFGSLESSQLLAKMRYLRSVLNVNFIILDHISIVISGNTSSSEGERRDIDVLMTALRSLVEETGVGVIAIVHLKQPEGKAHEEGGRVTLSHLRGSGSLKQLSDAVIGLERDSQSGGDESNQCTLRVLKNREHGIVGTADTLEYNHDNGRMEIVENELRALR